jgi:protein O-mannosyl-transferase
VGAEHYRLVSTLITEPPQSIMKKKRKKTNKLDNTKVCCTPATSESFSLRSLTNKTFVHIVCLVVLILIVYANTLNSPFQWDEDEFLVNNPIVNNLHYFASPSDAKGFQYYGHLVERYIGYLTFALNCKIHGFSVQGYHIVNVTIHIANSVLVYLLILLTFRTPFFAINDSRVTLHDSRFLIAFFSAMLFAVHPLQTEAVTYVFQRFVPLAALFSLMSLTSYVQSRLAAGSQQRFLFYCIALISALLAMKTKEIAFTLPVVIAVYEFLFFRDTLKRRIIFLAPMLLTMSIIPLTLIYLKVTMGMGKHDLPGVSYAVLSRGEYMLTQLRVIVTYLRLLLIPVNQNFDYDYPVYKSVFDTQVILSFLFLSTLFGLGIYLIRSSCFTSSVPRPLRLIGLGILWFFITLSVESSIVPLDRLIDEYRVYLPSVGISIAIVTGLFLIKERMQSLKAGKVIIALLVIVSGVFAIATYERNLVWGDKIGLWEDTVNKSAGSAEAHYTLGVAYKNQDMPHKAMEQYLLAVNLRPDYVEAHNNLGVIYKTFNMPDKALEQFLIVIKLRPDYADAHFNLGSLFYYRLGQIENARRELLAGLKIKPDDQTAQQLLQEISH